ncbi:MAG TPA: thiamine-phosphate kinase [Candidatus Methanomethylophilaceae archaeon]|nr:thiamine-phosphate kinase [Candidatus Methanomethylophilaceae archaeon]
MATFREIGERELIRRMMKAVRPSGRDGPGDDAALVDVDGRLAICSDILTFKRHMPEKMTFEQFGWMSAAVNFSDIASMGAKPNGFLISLALPLDTDEDDVYEIMNGADQCAEFCGTHILGGDTKEGEGLAVGTAIGCMEGREPMTRYGASPGDLIAVTGDLGSAAAGWYSINNELSLEDSELALMMPIPKIEEGIAMSKSGAVTSCIDLSDGLAEAAWSICGASHVGMEFRREFLPAGDGVYEVRDALGVSLDDLMLYWGGEYELLFTFKKDMIMKLYDDNISFTIIGEVDNGDSPKISDMEGMEELGHGIH